MPIKSIWKIEATLEDECLRDEEPLTDKEVIDQIEDGIRDSSAGISLKDVKVQCISRFFTDNLEDN